MANITNKINPSLDKLANAKEKRTIKELISDLAALIEERREVVDIETGTKTELKEVLKPLYFKYNTNATETDSVQHTFDVGEFQVNFINQYHIGDAEHMQALVKLLGTSHPLTDEISETDKITVDVTNLSPEDATALTKAITTIACDYDIKPEVQRQYGVSSEFHNLRHIYLTPADNMILDEELPVTIQVNPLSDQR